MKYFFAVVALSLTFSGCLDAGSTSESVAGSLLESQHKPLIVAFCDCDKKYIEEIAQYGDLRTLYERNDSCIKEEALKYQYETMSITQNIALACIKVARTQTCPEVYKQIEPYETKWRKIVQEEKASH